MQEERVLGYKLAKELTYEDMREVAGGGGSKNSTISTTNQYTHPIGMDMLFDSDLALDT
jgi:hypothetical protein